MSNLPNFPTIRPSLLLDFANSKQVDPRIPFTRSSTATYFDAQGVLRTAASGVPRIDHDPATGECKGLLIEEARTNLLLNSLIDGTNLATQTVTVTAVAHTISFYGSGSVNLSGAHSATVTGTGAYPSRKTLTFTPTAGSLTLTVTGDVKWAQLEAGEFATSHIPTTSAAATRAADVARMSGTNFSEWYRQDEGTFVVEYHCDHIGGPQYPSAWYADSGGSNRFGHSITDVNKNVNYDSVTAGVSTAYLAYTNAADDVKSAFAYRQNDMAASTFGGAVVSDTSTTVPPVTALDIGGHLSVAQLNGSIRSLRYYPKRLSNAELQALTA